jgi:hypothetical protein
MSRKAAAGQNTKAHLQSQKHAAPAGSSFSWAKFTTPTKPFGSGFAGLGFGGQLIRLPAADRRSTLPVTDPSRAKRSVGSRGLGSSTRRAAREVLEGSDVNPLARGVRRLAVSLPSYSLIRMQKNVEYESSLALDELVRLRGSSERPLVFWIGAGVSSWAGIKRWDELAQTMRSEFLRTESTFEKELSWQWLDQKAFPSLFGHCDKVSPTRYRRILDRELNQKSPHQPGSLLLFLTRKRKRWDTRQVNWRSWETFVPFQRAIPEVPQKMLSQFCDDSC